MNRLSQALNMGVGKKNGGFVVKTQIFLNTDEKISGFTYSLCGTF